MDQGSINDYADGSASSKPAETALIVSIDDRIAFASAVNKSRAQTASSRVGLPVLEIQTGSQSDTRAVMNTFGPSSQVCANQPVDTGLLNSDEVQRVFDANFDRLDRDKDGFVSEKEIDLAMIDPCFKGKDAQLVNVLKQERERLEDLSNDEWGPETKGVTKADMLKFHEIQAKSDKTKDERKLVDAVDDCTLSASLSVTKANRQIFGSARDPLSSISPEAVIQGHIGDCYFTAEVAALAATPAGKQVIFDMIRTNDDGTYTVTFPGDPKTPITVSAPTDAELGRYAKGNFRGIWPAVLEKAYGKYSDPGKIVSQDGIQEGDAGKKEHSLLIGSIDCDELSFTRTETTHLKLTKAMNEGRTVTAGISSEFGSFLGIADNKTDDAGLQGGHRYAVLSYDPVARKVTLYNPVGSGEPCDADGRPKDGQDDGKFVMTLEEFEKNFDRTYYAETSPKRS